MAGDHSKPPHPLARLRRLLRLGLMSAAALALSVVILNVGLVLALFGPGEGIDRLLGDWRRIALANDVERGRVTAGEAFERLYGRELGSSPGPEVLRERVRRDLEAGEPAMFDVIMARYILDRFGAIDGRTLPAGVYVAAGPIGPDAWPAPLLTHYLVFPRHGYLLVVPPERSGRWPPAYAATASLRKEFRSDGDANTLYAIVEPYRPEAYDFPTAGEPLHDLIRVSGVPADIAQLKGRLTTLRHSLGDEALPYRLLRRNSNSALACYLRRAKLASAVDEYVASSLLLRLRLPGIHGGQRLYCPA